MRVVIIDDYYTDISAEMVMDPMQDYFSTVMYQRALDAELGIANDLPNKLREVAIMDEELVEIIRLQCSDDEVYEPGWIFIEDSIKNLRSRRNSHKLSIMLKTPDNKTLLMLVNLKQLGYGIDNPIEDDTVVCEWLISTPIPPDGGQIDIPDYISNKFLEHIAFVSNMKNKEEVFNEQR